MPLLARVAVAADQTVGEAQPGIVGPVTGGTIMGHGLSLKTSLLTVILLSYVQCEGLSVNIV